MDCRNIDTNKNILIELYHGYFEMSIGDSLNNLDRLEVVYQKE